MSAHDGADKAQSQTVSRSRAASFEADKPVEHGLSIGVGNTLTAIGDFENSLFFTVEDPDLDLAAARIFERVVEQIGQRLGQQVTDAADPDVGFGREGQNKPVLFGDGLIEFDRRPGDLGEIHQFSVVSPRSRLQFSDAEKGIEGREQAIGFVDRRSNRVALADIVGGS